MIADEIERIRKAIFVEGSSDELHDEDSSKKSNIILIIIILIRYYL